MRNVTNYNILTKSTSSVQASGNINPFSNASLATITWDGVVANPGPPVYSFITGLRTSTPRRPHCPVTINSSWKGKRNHFRSWGYRGCFPALWIVNDLLRKHLPRMSSSIKNDSSRKSDDQIPRPGIRDQEKAVLEDTRTKKIRICTVLLKPAKKDKFLPFQIRLGSCKLVHQ